MKELICTSECLRGHVAQYRQVSENRRVKPVMIKHVDSGVLKQRLRECAVPNMKGSIDGCVTRTTETLHECMRSAKQKTDKH